LTAVEVSCRMFPRAEQRSAVGQCAAAPARLEHPAAETTERARTAQRGYNAVMQNSSAEEPTAPAYLNHLEKSECAFSSTSCAYPVPHSKYRIMQPCHMHHAACGTT
jgi:hypothetical protein